MVTGFRARPGTPELALPQYPAEASVVPESWSPNPAVLQGPLTASFPTFGAGSCGGLGQASSVDRDTRDSSNVEGASPCMAKEEKYLAC